MDNIYKQLLDNYISQGRAILTAGRIDPAIPVIQDVGNSLPTDTPVDHAGFGCFLAKVNGRNISFDGGGAMNRVSDASGKWLFSWTTLSADRDQLAKMGYDLDAVGKALAALSQAYLDSLTIAGTPALDVEMEAQGE